MKLVTFLRKGKQTLGVKVEEGIIDLEAALLNKTTQENIPTDIMQFIESSAQSLPALEQFISELGVNERENVTLSEQAIDWEPCVTQPSKIICVGLNYKKHADEVNTPYPEVPVLFNKFPNALTGHRHEVMIPPVTKRVDYEVELGIVIGKTAKNVSEDEALDYVFGYCSSNDVSARDLQKKTPQWMLGKTSDGFAPVGPYLVTKDEVGDPNKLTLKSTVNGEVRQHSNTSDMVFSCEEIISYISKHMTLVPGDLILTGTPEGVIIGLPKEKRVYLRDGDEVTVEVENLGALTNTFREEA
ncbi:fumarylacetoacetate hydrolase family protein [Virgibacillus sp. W0181]|uniref:fumarylacetoacetate hydrolase family protein n=1 Tax=Virgibacillus sp. W0181 TaxID=3391581 RepID=UPI003F487878